MDETEFRDQLLRLAQPIAATPVAVSAVGDRVRAKHRTRIVAALAAITFVVGAGAAVVAAAGGRSNDGQPTGQPNGPHITTYESSYGIRLGITTVFSDDRQLTHGEVQVGSATGKATMYANDGTDPDAGPAVPLALPAGVSTLVEATVQPNCDDGMPDHIEFAITSTLADGTTVVDHYPAADTDFYTSAYRLYCHVGVGVQVGGGGIGDGSAAVAVRVVNSTAEDITFQIPALTADGAQWEAVSATVPAGAKVALTAIGTGVYCGDEQADPWQPGRVLLNGQPYDVPVSDSWTC